ncbi:hypothetical protein CDIK_4429 [Cucumispora dikerogammari]|nr:hypothetical protein CDIK_4429 [Cucumispora dikerogammari]
MFKNKKNGTLIGRSPTINTGSTRSKNISVIKAVNKFGMIVFYVNNFPVNGEDFLCYIINLKNICLTKNIQETHFILDNSKIHHYKRLKELCETENIKLIFYFCTHLCSTLSKTTFRNEKNLYYVLLQQAVDFIKFNKRRFSKITRSDCNGFYRKMLRCIH